jgi:pyruvate dehydrogenase E2 component (dihydrolipoamide acetyltransferase)
MSFDFKLPDLGEGIHEAEVLAVKITEGQAISEDQILFEVETDKAVVEIPSPVAGKVLKILIKEGQIVSVGTVMISIEESAKDGSTADKNTSTGAQKTIEKSIGKEADVTPQNKQEISEAPIIATPATRQLAREMKIDLHKVPASGPGGKISKEDILAYAESLKGNKPIPLATASGIDRSVSDESILPDRYAVKPLS